MNNTKYTLVILILLNVVVLMGQIWPAGAPPFARAVNILFLASSLVFFILSLLAARKKNKQ